jgi:hypothetical protein
MPNKGLVVGISKYLRPTTELTAPALEADAWAALLPACDITDVMPPVKDSRATLTEVCARLADLFRGANPREKRVFVYSGHGTIVDTARGVGEEALQLFHPAGTIADAKAAVLTDSMMSEIIRTVTPKPSTEALITIVLECCFSGGFEVKPPASFLQVKTREEIEGMPLFSPLLTAAELSNLTIVHRFGSLWQRGQEFAALDPLVVAACERFKQAAELPVPFGAPPHLKFSAQAIPALQRNTLITHQNLCDTVNRAVVGQRAVLLGGAARHQKPFFT